MSRFLKVFGLFLFLCSVCSGQYIVDGKSYKMVIGDSNDLVTIGERTSLNFKPKVNFSYKGEENLSFEVEGVSGFPLVIDGKVKLSLSGRDYEFKKHDPNTFKWFDILKEKPPSNVWEVKIDGYKNFDFFYQTPLAEALPDATISYFEKDGVEYIQADNSVNDDSVHIRPLHIEGSIAIYHKIKYGNKYNAGKFFQIPRPKAVDSDGKWAWCDISAKDGVFRRVIPPAFYDSAVYPVTINETFGFYDVGDTQHNSTADVIYAFGPYTLSEGGTATKVGIWTVKLGTNRPATVGYYNNDGADDPDILQGDSAGGTSVDGGWTEQALDDPNPAITADDWWPACRWDDNAVAIFYDTATVGWDLAYKSGEAYSAGNLPNPFPAIANQADRKYTTRITYTPSGAAETGQFIIITQN